MADTGQAVIQTFLSQQLREDWETDWDTLAELAERPAAKPKLAQLQRLFPDQDIMPWSRDKLEFNLLSGPWDQLWGDQLPPPIALALLAASLSVGVTDAIRLAQQAAEVDAADGIMGPRTKEVLNKTDIDAFLSQYQETIQDSGLNPSESSEQNANPFIGAAQTAAKTSQSFAAEFPQQTKATPNTAPASEFTTHYESFDIDAIAKKSSSDIWTIEDQLGYASYAQAIAKLILEGKAQPPLTISIQAPWGQGKTSLMRMIQHRLEHGIGDKLNDDETKKKQTDQGDAAIPGKQTKLNDLKDWIEQEKSETVSSRAMLSVNPGTMPCIWFNPLYFQNSKQVWSGLAHAILHQLAEQLPSQLQQERFWFRLRLARIDTHAIRLDIHKLILERLLPKGWLWLIILLLMLIPQLFTSLPLSDILKSNAWLNTFPFAGFAVQSLISYLKKDKEWALDDKLAKYIEEPDYARDMGLLHLVDHDLDRALELLVGKDGRLCVFIDDLDRCSPETVNDILLAINQFISVQHRKLYFILGMDTHMVAMAIETASEKQAATYNKNRHTSKGYGWRFMEKFVQLPFFIPRIRPSQARRFMDILLREQPAPAVAKTAIDDVKVKIGGSANLDELQQVVTSFKREHNVDIMPEVDDSVASKMIDMTSDKTGETFKRLIDAAMTDLELNPREMKRFLNVARLLFIRLDRDADVSSDEHMLKVVRASHLILNWPQCLRWLHGNARSYTVRGDKADPVQTLEALLNNPGINSFEMWRDSIQVDWGKAVADTVAQPDFYTFCQRIHADPPNLQDIFEAGLF